MILRSWNRIEFWVWNIYTNKITYLSLWSLPGLGQPPKFSGYIFDIRVEFLSSKTLTLIYYIKVLCMLSLPEHLDQGSLQVPRILFLIPTRIRFVSPKNQYCDINMQYQILVEGLYTWIRAGSRCSIFYFTLPWYVKLYFGVRPRSVKPPGALNFIFDIRIWFVSPKNLN